jgi:hypothetical protein
VSNDVALLPTPTWASWLDRMECHFWAFVELVGNNSDYPEWAAFDKAALYFI